MADVQSITEQDPEIVAARAEATARRRAALQAIRQWGDPVLKGHAREVTVFDEQLRRELDTMGSLMRNAQGIGLAANQVGTLQRVLVYAVDGGDGPVRKLVNPEIVWRGDDIEVAEEGCLSLPGVRVEVERPVFVQLTAQDDYGAAISIEASGLEARVIQHEMDHLDGILILDRTPRGQRKQALRDLRAAMADDG